MFRSESRSISEPMVIDELALMKFTSDMSRDHKNKLCKSGLQFKTKEM